MIKKDKKIISKEEAVNQLFELEGKANKIRTLMEAALILIPEDCPNNYDEEKELHLKYLEWSAAVADAAVKLMDAHRDEIFDLRVSLNETEVKS